ncbi:MAG: hypothetical protein ACI81L_003088 [Verrucomicrobiales bacterium]|jgi:hypothetical protein
MSGLGIAVKVVIGGVVLLAAASGTEAVDVVKVVADVTQRAQDFAGDVEVEGDETGLFDESVSEDDVSASRSEVFARRGSYVFGVDRKSLEFTDTPVGPFAFGDEQVDTSTTAAPTTTTTIP